MIKNLKSWIKELTMMQQLLGVIFLFITLFLASFFLYINGNVNSFVTQQMTQVLTRAQNNTINNYYNSGRQNDPEYIYNDLNTVNAIYTVDNRQYFSIDYIERVRRLEIEEEIRFHVAAQQTESTVYQSANRHKVLYRITKSAGDGTVFVTVLSNDYQGQFKQQLLSSVINALVLVVSILFVILLMWVSYIIAPLNQIRNFINKIKNDEAVSLSIDRKDEIGQVANALVEMNAEIKRQELIKEELIQNISHDLKTPIATIKSYSESIKDGIYPYETLENSVDVIIEHADRLEKKVQSLLLLNRVGYLVADRDVGTVDMYQVVEKVLLSIKAINPEILIVTNLEHAEFYGNEEPWRVVIENLLDNAFRYAKSVITISLREGYISIENDGPQISRERVEKLFKPYEKGSDGQFGLGLSIVYRVVTAYGFEVYAENLESGVIFRIEKLLEDKKKLKQNKKSNKKSKDED